MTAQTNRARFPEYPIALVDDEELALQSMSIALRAEGYSNIITFSDSRDLLPYCEDNQPSMILLDLNMPFLSGEEVLDSMNETYPEIPVIIVTGITEIETAVRCMRQGAFDYMVKPIETEQLISTVYKALQFRELQLEYSALKERFFSKEITNPDAFASIITKNDEMITIFQYTESIAQTSKPVLITGETGVGKEMIAQAIHNLSGRPGSFVPVNVTDPESTLFSDSLFGHVRGAYTGAEAPRRGLIEQAEDGTLFLDEIGDLSLESQSKLLRLLQEKEYRPVGSDLPKRSNARIIAATNRNLVEMIENKQFRRDLFFRFKTHHIQIPPLRERRGDISLLVDYFIEEAAKELEISPPRAPAGLYELLHGYRFPGNVRELENMVFDAVSSNRSEQLVLDHFKRFIDTSGDQILESREDVITFAAELPTLKEMEEIIVREALRRSHGNQSMAARILGISRQALNKRIQKQD